MLRSHNFVWAGISANSMHVQSSIKYNFVHVTVYRKKTLASEARLDGFAVCPESWLACHSYLGTGILKGRGDDWIVGKVYIRAGCGSDGGVWGNRMHARR
jgi:hypothetical protein